MGGRIDIETDDVADLGGELRIVGKLEGTDAVRRQAMSLPDALNRGQANARHLGHQPPGPVRRLAGRIAERQSHDPLGRIQRQAGRTGRPGLVAQQALDAFVHEPRLPTPDSGLADPRRPHDLHCAHAIGRGQHDPGAPNMLLQAVAVINDRPQSLTISWAQMDDNASAHPADSHDAARNPNPDSFVPINPPAFWARPALWP